MLPVEAGEGLGPGDVRELLPQPPHLRLQLAARPRVGGPRGQVARGEVEGDEGVLDAADELGGVGGLPGVEAALVVGKCRKEALRDGGGNCVESVGGSGRRR